MRNERRHPNRALAGGLVALLVLWAVPVRAQDVYGTLQLQYQKADRASLVQTGDQVTLVRQPTVELWTRTLDLHRQDYARPDLMVESNLRYSDQGYLHSDAVTRAPYGSMRLIHPWYQVILSYQPTSVRSSLTSQSGLNPNSVTSRTVTSHNREALFNSHVGVPRWPSLDLNWVTHTRDGAGAVNDRNRSRSVRGTFDRDHYSMYGGVTDTRITSGQAGATTNTQQVWSSGSVVRYAPTKTTNVSAQYDLSDVLGEQAGVRRAATFSQALMLGGEWRERKQLSTSATYQWRRATLGTPNLPPQTDVESALMENWRFSPRANVLAGGGLRTVHTALPDGRSRDDLQKYATAISTVSARVRRNWSLNAAVSHTTNWDPLVRRYSVETATATTQAPLTSKIRVDGTMQLNANFDSAVTAQRWSNAWTMRVQATPLRTLMVALSRRSLRVGSGLLAPMSASHGMVLDVNWRPAPLLQVIGQYGSNAETIGATSSNSTRSLTARLETSTHWQWFASWTRSDQLQLVSSGGQLSSRETASGRVQYAPSRRLASSAMLSFNDPGRPQESRQIDLAFTWSFGR